MSLLKAIGEYQGKQKLYAAQTPEILKDLQQASVIESSESSNRLEGIIASHERIADLVLKNAQPKGRSEQEIAGYRDALNFIHQSAKHMSFSTSMVLQLHAWVYRYLPSQSGQWKTADNEIAEVYPDGRRRIRFVPTNAFKTPTAMDTLVKNYKESIEKWNVEPLLVIPAAILDFLCIHPFRDGNGRTARLLTLLLLYHFDFEVGRYISLERIFEESKESYYETLEKSSQGWHEGQHDILPWMTYFWGAILRAYKEFESRVGKISPGRGSKADFVRATVQNLTVPFTISYLEILCHSVSRDTIRLVLRQLKDEGVIEPLGKGRGAKWIRKF